MTFTNDPPLISSIDLIPDAVEKADLDAPSGSGGKLVIGQAPNITITETSVVADAAERLALDVQEGDVAIQTNVSSSFIFTGGDNIAPNWEVLDFDAVGAIAGEDIAPNDINALGDILGQSIDVVTVNGADTSAASAGEALTSDGSGNLSFASVGGIEEAATFGDLPAVDVPQLGYVINEEQYYRSFPIEGTAFDVDTLVFDKERPSEGTRINYIAFNNDGTKLYECDGSNTNKIYQLSLAEPYDITTQTLEKSINPQDSSNFPTGIAFNDDGTKFYELGGADDVIFQLSLSTPFEIDTGTLDGSLPTDNGFRPSGIGFSDDGTKLHYTGFRRVIQENLSTPFDVTTASFDTDKSSADSQLNDIEWNDDGTKLYELGGDDDVITQFTVSTPYDVSTATFEKEISETMTTPLSITWNDDGSLFYEAGLNNFSNGEIKQFTAVRGGWEAF